MGFSGQMALYHMDSVFGDTNRFDTVVQIEATPETNSKTTTITIPVATRYTTAPTAPAKLGDTFNGKGYVGQVGEFNVLITQLSEDHRALCDTGLAIREPRPTKDAPPPSSWILAPSSSKIRHGP